MLAPRPLSVALDGQQLREGLEVLTQPIGELTSIEAAGCQLEHDALLLIKACVNLRAVEHEEGLHGGMANALVPVDKGVVGHQREAEGRRLLLEGGIEVAAGQRHLGLRDGRFQRAKIPNPDATPGRFEESPVKLDDFRQRKVAHQARRRYNSSFFLSTRSAAALKSSSAVASRSAIAALARSSGVSPSRSASRRSRSA